MPFKKQLHHTCKHVDLISLICGKTFLFAAKKKRKKPTVIIKIKCLPNNTSLENCQNATLGMFDGQRHQPFFSFFNWLNVCVCVCVCVCVYLYGQNVLFIYLFLSA